MSKPVAPAPDLGRMLVVALDKRARLVSCLMRIWRQNDHQWLTASLNKSFIHSFPPPPAPTHPPVNTHTHTSGNKGILTPPPRRYTCTCPLPLSPTKHTHPSGCVFLQYRLIKCINRKLLEELQENFWKTRLQCFWSQHSAAATCQNLTSRQWVPGEGEGGGIIKSHLAARQKC